MSPLTVNAQQERGSPIVQLCAGNITVNRVLIFVSQFLTVAHIPHIALLIAGKVERIVKHTIVGLVARSDATTHMSFAQCRRTMQDEDTSHRIGAIHQRGRTLQYLNRTDCLVVNLQSMFIAPLLTFLTNTVVDHQHTVITQTADDGF